MIGKIRLRKNRPKSMLQNSILDTTNMYALNNLSYQTGTNNNTTIENQNTIENYETAENNKTKNYSNKNETVNLTNNTNK